MPLPEATLSLGPLISPGGTEPVKPKVAMLVRLSSATIDALTSVMNEKEKISVDLGPTSGIHIDGTFYPMRMQKEETPHEIYLRVPRSNSLKLYANVAEKLFIEHNEIGDDLKDKIRERTLEAAKQRDGRKTKMIEAPIQPPKATKKKRESASVSRNINRPSEQAKLNVSTSSARVSSPAPPPSTKPSSASAPQTSGLFNRLIRCIVVGKRNRDEIVKLVSGDDPSIRRDIIELMEEVGEPISPLKKGEDAGSKIWCLKAQSWLHVRPLEWPGLTTNERIHLLRTGRLKLASLGYSDKDPQWKHFAYRSTDTNIAAGKPIVTVSQGDTRKKPDFHAKSGKSASEMKKPKKSDPNAEIPMKDESLQARSSATRTKEFATSNLTAKKIPGSGFGAGKSSAQDSSPAAEGSRPGSEKGVKPVRRSLPPKTTAPSQLTQKERTASSATTAQRLKKRDLDAGFGSESERDRDSRPKTAIKQEERRNAEVPIVKSRQGPRDSYDSDASTSLSVPQKKRKLENGAVATSSSSKDVRSTDPSLPKKPDIVSSRPKVRKQPTPPPSAVTLPKINKKANGSSVLTANSNGNASKSTFLETTSSSRTEGKVSGKRRRGSPIYTSSEDEGESTKIRRITKASSPAVESNNHKTFHSRRREHEQEPRPLPTDHAGLRMRYTTTYSQCMKALTTLLAQKARIDSLLRHTDAGSVTDSDCDGELMDVEDLKKLSGDYERMHEELETIRQKFADPVQ